MELYLLIFNRKIPVCDKSRDFSIEPWYTTVSVPGEVEARRAGKALESAMSLRMPVGFHIKFVDVESIRY